MSQTAITLAFEQWKAQQAISGDPVLLDEFVFANVPGLNTTNPVSRTETLPPAGQIVHRQAVSREGVVNTNAVVYSVVLGADVGDFSFNWIGLINKATGTLAMIVHAPLQQKIKTAAGKQGNVLTRSFLMEFNGAQKETAINTPADTWQIDFTARLAGVDERQRVENVDIYGAGAFFDAGWQVVVSGTNYSIKAGTGYVGGLRAVLAADTKLTVTTKPVKVWVDACWTGTLTSAWGVTAVAKVAASMTDYEQDGVKHYVFAVAQINADGTVTDLRPKNALNQQAADDALAAHEKSRNHPDGTLNAKGFVQLSSATNSTSETLAATPKAVKAVMDETNKKAPKDSPALTGTPTTPTPPKASRDTTIANTEFVQAALDPAIMWRGMLPAAAHLNNFGPTSDFIGSWTRSTNTNTSTSYGFPEDNGQGVFEVMPGGLYGCTHRYTARNGNIYTRTLVGAWNGSDGPWSGWVEASTANVRNIPVDAVSLTDPRYFYGQHIYTINISMPDMPEGVASNNASILTSFKRNYAAGASLVQYLHISGGRVFYRAGTVTGSNTNWTAVTWQGGGLNGWKELITDEILNKTFGMGAGNQVFSAVDWQTFAFVNGAAYQFNSANWLNAPDPLNTFTSGTFAVNVTNASGDTNATTGTAWMHFTATFYSTGSNRRIFQGVFRGPVGARVYHVQELFTSSRIIPLANGGLGATTPEGGRAALGFDALGVGNTSLPVQASFDWQQADFLSGQNIVATTTNWKNAPADLADLPAAYNVCLNVLYVAGTTVMLLLSPSATAPANQKLRWVRITGSKGSREFAVRTIFHDGLTVPLESGGTGANTAAGAVDKLGLRDTVNKAAGALQRSGGSMTGALTLVGESSCAGTFRANDFTALGTVYAGNGGGQLATDGNIYGSIWGGYLSTWLNSQFVARDNSISVRATWDWVTNGFLPRVQSQDTIGTFIWAYFNGGNVNLNDVVSGGNLSPATGDGTPVGWYLPGSWRCAGMSRNTNDAHRTTLWQRVA